jgi:hypothetical protein
MKIAAVNEKYGHSVNMLAQKESGGDRHKIQQHSINIRRG